MSSADIGWRQEQKFWLIERHAWVLEPLLRQLLDPDPHGDDGSYDVTSLYFDSPDLRLARETFDGLYARSKYRVRYYGDDSSRLLLEVKQKRGAQARKHRGQVELAQLAELEPMIEGGAPGVPPVFVVGCAQGLQPRLWVRYRRTALVGRHDGLRVTIDERLAAGVAAGYRLPVAPLAELQLSCWQPRRILEVKYGRVLPSWLVRALQSLHLAPEPISKYELGLSRTLLHQTDTSSWTH